ncbi:hypothetical protein QS257_14580 [Terrilactibacillus sp. S3-3]|nr:hypothetical protein QS257_14580 [Terrilactibacillus sp. S3-3]
MMLTRSYANVSSVILGDKCVHMPLSFSGMRSDPATGYFNEAAETFGTKPGDSSRGKEEYAERRFFIGSRAFTIQGKGKSDSFG